jgi:hypothetical protein
MVFLAVVFLAIAVRLATAKGGDVSATTRAGDACLPDGAQEMCESAILNRSGDSYVLEVRGLSVTAWELISYEIWDAMKKQASPYDAFISKNPKDYPYSNNLHSSNANETSAIAVRAAMGRAVNNWPLPMYVVLPPPTKGVQAHAGGWIPGMRQAASLATHLPTDQGSVSTFDGASVWHAVFKLFEDNPDVPEALIFVGDGETVRLGRGWIDTYFGNGHRVPSVPDSFSAFLVSRSDHVSATVRTLAAKNAKKRLKEALENNVTKLWYFYWKKNDGPGEDGYEAYWHKYVKPEGWRDSLGAGQMSSAWWQAQLPEFWEAIGPAIKGFTRSNYFPIPWTSWQLRAFDAAPLIGYIHKPVTVDLSSENAKALNERETTKRLTTGLETALRAARITDAPLERVFYDSTDDKMWVVPLSRAVAEATESSVDAMSLTQGFDIGVRIGNTGINAPYLQMGLGLIASYLDGGTSVSIARRPGDKVDIVVLSPPIAVGEEAPQDLQAKKENFLP